MAFHLAAYRDHACLIVHGPDQPGLVASVTALITRTRANIVSLDQYSDNPQGGAFFQRTVFHRPDLPAALAADRGRHRARVWRTGSGWSGTLTDRSGPKRVAIFASKSRPLSAGSAVAASTWRAADDHPDGDLEPHQHRRRRPLVRHPVLPRPLAAARQVGRRGRDRANCSPATSTSSCWPGTCRSSPTTSSSDVGVPVINIHHSFLPAFIGAAPYRRRRSAA